VGTAVLDAPLLGNQTPRFQLMPQITVSQAQDAIDIYEACGQRLDDWQELCLHNGCGLREDLNWASFENGVVVQRQNGKGAVIEALCLASLFIWGNQKTIYAAHRLDTAQSTFSRVRALVETTADLTRRCKKINDSDYAITLLTGATIEFKTRTASGGRGLTGDLVILDEALELNIEQIKALVPTLLARVYAQLWYFSTVPAFGDQHLCTVRARAQEGDSGLSWVEWGVDKADDLDDPRTLAAANPAYGIRLSQERLRHLRKILGDDGFKTECLGIWPELAAGTVLSPSRWKAMLDASSRRAPGSDVVLSLDMTPMRDVGTIGMHGFRQDGLEHVQVVDFAPDVDWMVGRAGQWQEAVDPALWVIDGRNGVHAFLDQLKAVGINLLDPVMVRALTGRLKESETVPEIPRGSLLVLDAQLASDAVGQFIDAFNRKAGSPLRHVGQEPLDLAIPNSQAKVGEHGQIMWTRKLSEVNISPTVAVTNARLGSFLWLARPRAKALQKPWVV